MDIYGLPVTCIPTALPVARRDNADAVFRTQNGKWKAVMGDIARRHTKGQPILVGTTSVLASQQLSKLLEELKVPHEVCICWVYMSMCIYTHIAAQAA